MELKKMIWTDKKKQYLIDNYELMTRAELCEKLGCTLSSFKNMIHKLHLAKDRNAGSFKKGHKPWNKGLKHMRLSEATQFHKGNLPPNTKHDGYISVRNHTVRKYRYKYIRLSKSVWVPYHTYLYKSVYGEVPRGSIVVFRDGDTMNCEIDNLELISLAENLKRNRKGYKYLPLNSDKYIASRLSFRDKELREELLKHPELIEIKRQQLLLRSEINGKRTA